MTLLWFCTTLIMAALCLTCWWTRAPKLYSWLQVSFLAQSPLLIWAYYSPAISRHVYEELWYWSQRYTQAGEFAVFVLMIRPSLPFACNLIGALNMIYFLLKTQTNADYQVPEEIARSFDLFVQQWVDIFVIIASCALLVWCKFQQERETMSQSMIHIKRRDDGDDSDPNAPPTKPGSAPPKPVDPQ